MRLATRTGLAAMAAATLSLLMIGAVFNRILPSVVQDRVDAELEDRSRTAPILAAVGERLAQSELSGTVDGARVALNDGVVELGRLPDAPLPPIGAVGFDTTSADGDRWRTLTVEVTDVPEIGDRTLVQLVAPLGDADERTADLRRRTLVVGIVTVAFTGAVGHLLGRRAGRPLVLLRDDASRWADGAPSSWSVADTYGSPEVDDVAAALNESLARAGEESDLRITALETARAFAASAAHELRTPLQSALTNVDIARSPLVDDAGRSEAIEQAHLQLQRLRSGLEAVRALADAELAQLSWFVPTDLVDVVGGVVADQIQQMGTAVQWGPPDEPVVLPLWLDGARLAIDNVIRNALVHGGPSARVVVRVVGPTVMVDDDGPGVPPADRERLLGRFERRGETAGSGLGLAIAHQIAGAHGGTVSIGESPDGGARVVIMFSP